MTAIEELGSAIASVAGTVGPSIVGVGRDGRRSGVVVADGQVLTNAHNLRGDEVTVTFTDGRSTRGSVAGVDGDGDLAVIAVDTGGAAAIEWGSGEGLAVGSAVFGGAATFGGGVRVTFGLVSAVARAFRGPGGRRIAGSVEHTAPMAPGSSGGALLDAEGRLVGLNTNRIGEGFYLALPADAALRGRVEALSRGESPERPRLGVAIAPSHVARRLRRSVGLPDRAGILVRGVEEGSLADAAGVEAGDLIVSAGGRPIADADDLHEALGVLTQPFELGLVRGAEERTVTIGTEAKGKTEGRTPGDA
jgi:serine protease Do